jgi:TetR/AcrR family transcriptional regulator, mexJK operon transcriptional repressor
MSAAAEVFAKRGFTSAKATDIAVRAGVSVGTLYLHFGDKDGIARAVAEDAFTELRARLRSAVERKHSTIDEAARAHATALVDFVADPNTRGRLLFAYDAPGLRGDLLDAMAAAQEAHVLERRRDGYFRADIDATVAAQALVGMQSRVLTWWLENPRRKSRKTVIDTLAKLRLSGIHARCSKEFER